MNEVMNERSNEAFLADLRLRKIGFVFQTFNLIATMSAFENVELPMLILGKLSPKEYANDKRHNGLILAWIGERNVQ